jgi:hypothetical protein
LIGTCRTGDRRTRPHPHTARDRALTSLCGLAPPLWPSGRRAGSCSPPPEPWLDLPHPIRSDRSPHSHCSQSISAMPRGSEWIARSLLPATSRPAARLTTHCNQLVIPRPLNLIPGAIYRSLPATVSHVANGRRPFPQWHFSCSSSIPAMHRGVRHTTG